MNAKVVMLVDGEEYPYGTYPYNTSEERTRVIKIANQVSRERNVETDIVEVE